MNNTVVKDIDEKQAIENSLFQYVSHYVSCRPYSEYRHNINLRLIFSTIKSNVTTIRGVSIQLPTNGRWYLYYIDNNVLMNVKLPDDNQWHCLADKIVKGRIETGFCSQHKMDIRIVVGSTSLCIPRKFVFIRKNPTEDNFIFAINQEPLRKLGLGHVDSPDDIWASFYYHHVNSKFHVIHFSTIDEAGRKLFASYANANGQIVFLNGEIVTSPLSLSDIKENDYAEIVIDDSIVGYIDVDTTYKNNRYDSRYLVHIPKSFNPDNYILNHRVCDFAVVPIGSKTGRYINRAKTTKYFFTLTHQDFGVSSDLINNYKELLQTQAIKLRVYVRNHKKTGLILNRDSKYIACLYRLGDETIVNNLLGKTSMKIWSAKELEVSSPYSDLLDQGTERSSNEKLQTWLNCLGYPTAVDVSCKRVFHILATPDLLHKFYLPLPAYYLDKKVTAHIYLKGKLIDPDHITFERELQYLKIFIDPSCKFSDNFTNNQPVSIETYLKAKYEGKLPYFTVEIFENPDYRAGIYTLDTNESTSFYVDQDYIIYYSVNFDNRNKLPDDIILKRFPFKTSYRELTVSEMLRMVQVQNIEGTTLRKVTITNTVTKRRFIVVSKHAYAKIYGVELRLKEMNYDIFCSHLLMVKAKPWINYNETDEEIIPDSKNVVMVPYLNTNNEVLVYLNRRELTPKLDFRLYQAKTKTGNLCGQFVVMQNVDYLTACDNVFEVYSVAEKNTLCVSGFLTDGRSTFESYYSLFPNSSVLITDGFVYNHAPSTVVGEYSSNLHHWCNVCNQCNLYHEIRRGASTKIRAMMPYEYEGLVDSLKLSTDLQNIKDVTNYMESMEYDLETPAIIERSHHIYSTFLQTIIEEVCRGRLIYNLNWTDQEIKDALSPYESMLKYDIGLSNENREVTDPDLFIQPPKSGIDYRFVDVLPTYRIEPLIEDIVITDKYPLLVVEGSAVPCINGNYICYNPEATEPIPFVVNERTSKIWKNEKGAYIIHQIVKNDGYYWFIHDIDGNSQYRAEDRVGVDKIWELKWESLNNDNPISITPVQIEFNTMGEFLARRLSFTLKANDKTFLTRVAKIYLNKDLVLDGVNIT